MQRCLVSVIGSGQQESRRAGLIPVAPPESVPCLLSPACSPRFPGSSRLGLFVFPAYFARPSTTLMRPPPGAKPLTAGRYMSAAEREGQV